VLASGLDDVMGVVIVDHGSRRKASNDLLEEFVRMYKEQTGRAIVEIAHMEIAEPDIEHAFGKCVEQGATFVAVSPFFLSPGRHWQEDIPTLAAEAAAKHPGVGHFVAAPIGLHPLMVDIVDSRLETCLRRLTGGGASFASARLRSPLLASVRLRSPPLASASNPTNPTNPPAFLFRLLSLGGACDVCDGTDFGCERTRGANVDE
jgi:sirohydrochlorin ferrochelatase